MFELATIYCDLVENGALLYIPPNENPNTDLIVISHEKDLHQVLESQGSSQNIEMYVMPPLSQEECVSDQFFIMVRNKVIHKAKAGRHKESNLGIGKKQVLKESKNTKDPPVVDKRKNRLLWKMRVMTQSFQMILN